MAGRGSFTSGAAAGVGSPVLDTREVERAAVRLLRRRGYSVVPPENLDLCSAIVGVPGGGDSKALCFALAAKSFAKLARWAATFGSWTASGLLAGSATAALSLEFKTVMVPILIHLFFRFADEGAFAEARHLLEASSTLLYVPSLCGSALSSYKGLLERLKLIQSWPCSCPHVDEAFQRFKKEERSVIVVSSLARELLAYQLLCPETACLADALQRSVKLVVLERSLAENGSSESLNAAVASVNAGAVFCEVDTSDPPMRYGEPCGDERASRIDAEERPRYSAAGMGDQHSLPLPPLGSRFGLSSSASFSAQASARDMLEGDALPTCVGYILVGGGDGEVNCCALSGNGRYCAAGARSTLRLWSLDFGRSCSLGRGAFAERLGYLNVGTGIGLIGHRGRVLTSCFSPDQELLASGGQDGSLRLWSVRHQVELNSFSPESGPVFALDWCVAGHYLLSGASNGETLLWSVEHTTPLRSMALCPPWSSASFPVDALRSHPNSRHVAAVTEERVVLWDFAAAQPARVFSGMRGVASLAFSADGLSLAAGMRDGSIELWDVASARRRPEALLQGVHIGPTLSLDFSWPAAEESVLFSGGLDGVVNLWRCGPEGLTKGCRHLTVPLMSTSLCGVGFRAHRPLAVVAGRFTPANMLFVVGVAG